jgi:tetratricopeptide (TPR) repeat protein
LADPKAMMDVYNQALAAEALYMRGQYDEAAAVAQKVLGVCAGCVQARRVLAFSRLKQGQPGAALALLREGVARKQDTFLIRSLAQALILSGELAQAWEVLALYEVADPADGQVPLLRGDILVRQDRLPEAVAAFEAAIRLDENRVGPAARERIARIGDATSRP